MACGPSTTAQVPCLSPMPASAPPPALQSAASEFLVALDEYESTHKAKLAHEIQFLALDTAIDCGVRPPLNFITLASSLTILLGFAGAYSTALNHPRQAGVRKGLYKLRDLIKAAAPFAQSARHRCTIHSELPRPTQLAFLCGHWRVSFALPVYASMPS
jgi:hypothetical protein